MHRITIEMDLSDEQIESGWASKLGEVGGSVAATLHEIIGDDGMPYVPENVSVTVKQVCSHCGRECHYDTAIEDYQHTDADAPDCFLIQRRH
jgi:hypothetical protein